MIKTCSFEKPRPMIHNWLSKPIIDSLNMDFEIFQRDKT